MPKSPKPAVPEVRKGQGDMQISRDAFRERFRERFYDPAFERAGCRRRQARRIAWSAYQDSRKSARTRTTGEGFADPSMQLSVQWLATRVSDFAVDLLDLSRLTAEYGRVIYPCKAWVSTAMPLCHWPCYAAKRAALRRRLVGGSAAEITQVEATGISHRAGSSR